MTRRSRPQQVNLRLSLDEADALRRLAVRRRLTRQAALRALLHETDPEATPPPGHGSRKAAAA